MIENSRLKLPVIVAPMFLVSGVELVVESCKAGMVGTFPALNCRTTEQFEQWLIEINKQLGPKAFFGVNLIVHKSNPRLMADLEVCAKQKVPLIITSLGAVKDVVSAVQAYGGKVFHDVTQAYHAQKAADAGVDGLILVSAGAGGHAGVLNPFALINEVKSFFKKTIVLAGAISTGREVLAAQVLGAEFAYMGTRFIASKESLAADDYKATLVKSTALDIVYTPAVSGIPANFIRSSLEKAGYNEGQSHEPKKLSMSEEAKAWKDVWSAGHGVGQTRAIESVSQIATQLIKEYNEAMGEFKK
jgi:nitronate monooxygenase